MNNKNSWLAVASAIGTFFLLVGCNGSGNGSDAVVATADTPFVTASCSSGSGTVPSTCSDDATSAVFTLYSGPASSRTQSCTDLLAHAAQGLLPTAYLSAVTTVVCDSGTCTATPASVWLDSSGHVISQLPKGDYTVFVRFTKDSGNPNEIKPSDAFLCKSTTIDTGDEVTSLTVGELQTPDFSLAPVPEVDVGCTSDGKADCNQFISGNPANTYFIKNTTCAQVQTNIQTNGLIALAPELSYVPSLACNAIGMPNCSYSIAEGASWTDEGGSQISEIRTGAYAVVSVINGVVARKRSPTDQNIHAQDIVQCRETTVVAPSSVDVTNIVSMSNTQILTTLALPTTAEPNPVISTCTIGNNPDCTADLQDAFGIALLFAGKTCTQIQTALQNGDTTAFAPLAQTNTTVDCGARKGTNGTDGTKGDGICTLDAFEWSHEVPDNQAYALVTIMDKFSDFPVVGSPAGGDIIQCKSYTVLPSTRGQRTQQTMGDTDILPVTLPRLSSPALHFACNSADNPLCTADLDPCTKGDRTGCKTSGDTSYFIARNVSCGDLVANGIGKDVYFSRFLAGGGSLFKKDSRKFPIENFSCSPSGTKSVPTSCSMDINPQTDMFDLVEQNAHNDSYVPFRYFRAGGPFTVVAVVGQWSGGGDGGRIFCQEYSAWNASTTSLGLNSSTLSAFAPPASHISKAVDWSDELSR